MAINRPAFEKAVRERSPLSPERVESLFGGVTPENREMVWRFLNLTRKDQMLVWDACRRLNDGTLDVVVEAVR